MRDALERAPQAAVLEREAERVGRDILETMRLVDDEVVRFGQQRTAHARVLQKQRVIRHDDAGASGRLACALQVAASRDPGTPACVARLVVGGHASPQVALGSKEVQLGAIAGQSCGPPNERLQQEPRLVTRRDESAERLPASRAQIIRSALQHRDLDRGAERRLQRRQILAHELVLERQRVCAHDHALAAERTADRGHEIRERLPHSGAGLREQRATIAERALDRAGERALLRAVLVSREPARERSIGREHAVDGDRRADETRTLWARRCRQTRRLPRAADGSAQGTGEEGRVRGAEKRRVRLNLLEHRKRQLARAAPEVGEYRGAGQCVVERAVGRLGVDSRVGSERLQRVRRCRGPEDRRELRSVESFEWSQRCALKEREIESDVVARDRRSCDERRDAPDDRLECRRADEVAVTDPGEARDRRADVDAGVDERAVPLAQCGGAVLLETNAHRADLDDAVRLRVEPGGFDVERDELQRSAVLAAAPPRRCC